MSTTWHGPYELDPQQLRRDISSVRDDLDQLTWSKLPALSEEVDDVRRDLRGLESQAEEMSIDLGDHGNSIDELDRTARQLRTSVQWIERHIRSSGDVKIVDLDNVEDRLRTAARSAAAGHQAATELLVSWDRQELERQVREHAGSVARLTKAEGAVLGACVALTVYGWADEAHRTARTGYRAARAEWATAAAHVRQLTAAAATAREALTADDTVRQENAPLIEAGDRAWTLLLTSLRTKIAQAVSDGELLPVWLHNSLGPMPPQQETTGWVDVGAQIVAYRITYGVRDPLAPLGELPPEASTRQREWARQIEDNLRDFTP